MRLLSDRIQEFIDWLEVNTDFGEWDNQLKTDVHKKLIEFMISDPPEPKRKHQWEFYANGSFCKVCGATIGSDTECK
ncbi:MAG: hypothetical protein ABWY25_06230 [Paenisporosarcina sp.]